ncbi:MAG: glycosyltransferase family 1 protein [Pseudomonadota bacterium]
MQNSTDIKLVIPQKLEITSRGSLVLLFYDGFERQADDGFIGGIKSDTRRFLRYAKRTVCRQQVRTGFYTAFIALVNSLRVVGCDVRINDFAAARKRPNYPIGIAGYPSVIDKITLPNPIIFGPGDFGTPPASVSVAKDPRFKLLIQPSDWFSDMYRPFCGDKMLTWFAGIDTDNWRDYSHERKDLDYIVYDKIRWHREQRVPAIFERITRHLDNNGRSYKVLRYGHHHHSEFQNSLKRARAMIFVCEHETQGLAYQEALSSNVPVLAWDEGEMVDPMLQPYMTDALDISSVPYFNEKCGMKFKIANFEKVCDSFWQNLSVFEPRDYVKTHLSLELSAKQYLEAYQSIINNA